MPPPTKFNFGKSREGSSPNTKLLQQPVTPRLFEDCCQRVLTQISDLSRKAENGKLTQGLLNQSINLILENAGGFDSRKIASIQTSLDTLLERYTAAGLPPGAIDLSGLLYASKYIEVLGVQSQLATSLDTSRQADQAPQRLFKEKISEMTSLSKAVTNPEIAQNIAKIGQRFQTTETRTQGTYDQATAPPGQGVTFSFGKRAAEQASMPSTPKLTRDRCCDPQAVAEELQRAMKLIETGRATQGYIKNVLEEARVLAKHTPPTDPAGQRLEREVSKVIETAEAKKLFSAAQIQEYKYDLKTIASNPSVSTGTKPVEATTAVKQSATTIIAGVATQRQTITLKSEIPKEVIRTEVRAESPVVKGSWEVVSNRHFEGREAPRPDTLEQRFTSTREPPRAHDFTHRRIEQADRMPNSGGLNEDVVRRQIADLTKILSRVNSPSIPAHEKTRHLPETAILKLCLEVRREIRSLMPTAPSKVTLGGLRLLSQHLEKLLSGQSRDGIALNKSLTQLELLRHQVRQLLAISQKSTGPQVASHIRNLMTVRESRQLRMLNQKNKILLTRVEHIKESINLQKRFLKQQGGKLAPADRMQLKRQERLLLRQLTLIERDLSRLRGYKNNFRVRLRGRLLAQVQGLATDSDLNGRVVKSLIVPRLLTRQARIVPVEDRNAKLQRLRQGLRNRRIDTSHSEREIREPNLIKRQVLVLRSDLRGLLNSILRQQNLGPSAAQLQSQIQTRLSKLLATLNQRKQLSLEQQNSLRRLQAIYQAISESQNLISADLLTEMLELLKDEMGESVIKRKRISSHFRKKSLKSSNRTNNERTGLGLKVEEELRTKILKATQSSQKTNVRVITNSKTGNVITASTTMPSKSLDVVQTKEDDGEQNELF